MVRNLASASPRIVSSGSINITALAPNIAALIHLTVQLKSSSTMAPWGTKMEDSLASTNSPGSSTSPSLSLSIPSVSQLPVVPAGISSIIPSLSLSIPSLDQPAMSSISGISPSSSISPSLSLSISSLVLSRWRFRISSSILPTPTL